MNKKEKNFDEVIDMEEDNLSLEDLEFNPNDILEDDIINDSSEGYVNTDSVSAYFDATRASGISLLNVDDERKYGEDLLLHDDIKIFTKKKYYDGKVEVIDLETLFVSLYDYPYANDIINLLSLYYRNKNTGIGQLVGKYLIEYKKLVKSIGGMPNKNQLQEYFNDKDVIKRLNNSTMFSNYINKSSKHSFKKDNGTETSLLEEVNNYIKYNRAFDKFVESNLMLVASIAKSYSHFESTFGLEDLISEGNRGLLTAIRKFDIRKGFKFSTYATWWIKQAMLRSVAEKDRTIRVPVHMYEWIRKVNRMRYKLEIDNGRVPTDKEVAKALNISIDKLNEINVFDYDSKVVSFDIPVGDDSDSTLVEFMVDEKVSERPEEIVTNDSVRNAIFTMISSLSEKEQTIIKMRFGLNEYDRRYTLEEIGKEFKVTRERIRQIEANALRKLKIYFRKNDLENALGIYPGDEHKRNR